MLRYYKKQCTNPTVNNPGSSSSKESELEEILNTLPADPGTRPPMLDYEPNIRDQVRRAYLQRAYCRPILKPFPQRFFSGVPRRFNSEWYDEFHWLEYSIEKDAAYCICCYLFSCNFQQGSNDVFVGKGFENWKKGLELLRRHEGGVSSVHNNASKKCLDLMNQKQHIETVLIKHTDQSRVVYRIMLNAAIDCTRFLLRQGLPFCGHDEKEGSDNRGNYIELLQFLGDHDEKIKAVILENAPGNLKLVAPSIQKDLVNACAMETIDAILRDMNGAFFSIMVDESRDASIKEQMAVVFRYVNKIGEVIERFVGVQHVAETTSIELKKSIDQLFSRNKLSISMLRGQGYDGASNMKGDFNGLKSRILRENPCAFYVHCFAHQLQLALVAVAKGNVDIATFFTLANSVVTIVGASCKRRDALREQLQKDLMEAFENDCHITGRGLNQETSLKRAGDTRWNSHYGTLISIISMFGSVVKVLEMIVDDGSMDNVGEANRSLGDMQSFEFVFDLFLMKSILGVTNDLSQALQKKDQEIVNAMILVKVCKQQLQNMRENGFHLLFDQVSSFCDKHDIEIPSMDDQYVTRGRSRRGAQRITNFHHYHVELFVAIIDKQLVELNSRFDEVNIELLLCLASLSPDDSFSAFDEQKLICLAKFYPNEFTTCQLLALEDQLGHYILDMRLSSEFSQLKGIGSLAKKMVETGRNRVYNHVYFLITLALVLPVATASVERAFSAMNIVKTPLRNRMGDQWLSDSMIVYIESNVFSSIDNEAIMQRFQNMKTRRGLL